MRYAKLFFYLESLRKNHNISEHKYIQPFWTFFPLKCQPHFESSTSNIYQMAWYKKKVWGMNGQKCLKNGISTIKEEHAVHNCGMI